MLTKNTAILLAFLTFLFITPLSYATVEKDISPSLVKIYTTSNIYNYKSPWQAPSQKTQSGSGFVIEKNRILTNAHVVFNHAFVEVRRSNDAKRYLADVEFIDHDCDLALLKPRDSAFFDKTISLELGTLPKTRERVTVFGFPIGGEELSITEGIVSRIENQEYTHSGIKLLIYQIDAAINPGNSGGPVLSNNKVVGVAHQGYFGSQSIGYMIPISIVNHFLKDTENKTYQGFPTLGIEIQFMESPDLRTNFGMTDTQTGVRISEINFFSSATGILKTDDIILEIDNTPVFNDGTVFMNKNTRLSLDYLVSKSFIGQKLPIKILRNKEIKTVEVPLTNRVSTNQLVPFKFDYPPTYYIFSGLVFQPLTQNFLYTFNSDNSEWQRAAPKDLLYLLYYGRLTENRKQVVLLNRVLSDQINIGYQDIQNAIIEEINGKHISTIQDVIEAIEKNQGPYHTITTDDNYKIILEKKKAEEGQTQIFKKYSIHSDRSVDLMHQIKDPVLMAR